MSKVVVNSKGVTLFLNQVYHTNVMFDHDSDPDHPSPLMSLSIDGDAGITQQSPSQNLPHVCNTLLLGIEPMTLPLTPS